MINSKLIVLKKDEISLNYVKLTSQQVNLNNGSLHSWTYYVFV